jgi:hypothetical protein
MALLSAKLGSVIGGLRVFYTIHKAMSHISCPCSINYTPTSAITFQGAYCEPGNYQGKNTTMQALAYCT